MSNPNRSATTRLLYIPEVTNSTEAQEAAAREMHHFLKANGHMATTEEVSEQASVKHVTSQEFDGVAEVRLTYTMQEEE